jgi:hypothetical protein
MAKEVFNRYENKFLIGDDVYCSILSRLLDRMEPDKHNEDCSFYTISNIYFDTKDNLLISNSLSKPTYKEKLRLRSYGVPKSDDRVFLEIKKKYNGMVNKRRTRMNLYEAYEFVRTGIKPEIKDYMNRQVISEIEYMLKLYDLEPRLYLAYDRKALCSSEERGLRVTFDTNIRTRRYDLKLERGDYGEPLMDKGEWLMEIKAERSIPLWLTKLLSEYKIYRTGFSKYGTEYERQLIISRKMKGENIICLNHFSTLQQLVPQCL